MSDLMKYIISDIAFAVGTFLVTYILYAVRIKQSVMLLLGNSIYVLYKECEKAQYRTLADTMTFKEMTKQYYSLGGDGYIHDIEKRFLKIKEQYDL